MSSKREINVAKINGCYKLGVLCTQANEFLVVYIAYPTRASSQMVASVYLADLCTSLQIHALTPLDNFLESRSVIIVPLVSSVE